MKFLAQKSQLLPHSLFHRAIFFTFIALFLAGYYLYSNIYIVGFNNITGHDIAKRILKAHGDIVECEKIYSISLSGEQSQLEQQINCIYGIAKMSHNPLVCGYFLPSEFALDCVNDVISEEYFNDPLAMQIPESECIGLKEETLKQDTCQLLEAHKTKNLNDCGNIRNMVIRSGCEIQLETWNKYPQLRTSSYFGKYREQ